MSEPPRPPHVDYEHAAGRYDAGRSLGERSMESWRDAARARLPAGAIGVVADIGSGTGLFAEAWLRWGARAVIAIEPSASMRAKAIEKTHDRAPVVAAVAEQLPVSTASVDVVWMSAVLHHFSNIESAAREAARVLRPEGRVLVRGLVADRSTVAWLDVFAGADRARARFPTSGAIERTFASAGLALRDIVEVVEPGHHHGTDAADWVELMRNADSLLTALTDDEIERGVTKLREIGDAELPATALTLMTFSHQ